MKPGVNAVVYLLTAVVAGGSATLLAARALAADPPASPAATPAPATTAAPTATTPAPTPATAALEPECDDPVATAPASTAMDAGMRAYIDPETGQLTSQPPDGIPHPGEPALPAPPMLIEQVLPDGSVMLDLQGTLQDYMVVQVDASGALVVRCSDDPAAATQPAPPAPKREDR